ncbi:MAG TPA: hypothetical protein V6C86_23975 [Oculatellaceae cyanobacterium]
MQEVQTSTKQKAHQGLTTRKDTWWLEPLLVAVGFAGFIIYGTFRAFENAHYEFNHYLSPFYSPKLLFNWWKFSPAFLILWIPGGFRATCYYYRKAYYRAFFWDPPACSVGHMGGESYGGETSFPLILQNMHRYFFYLATVVLIFLWVDVFQAMFYNGGVHLSLVSLIMLVNCVFLSGYSFGCHAFRHLVGGRLDCFSCPSAHTHYKGWKFVTKLNEHHQLWAWISLFSVGFTDFYIRQVSMNALPEMPFF